MPIRNHVFPRGHVLVRTSTRPSGASSTLLRPCLRDPDFATTNSGASSYTLRPDRSNRAYATSSNESLNIGILGGGITGLSTAYYITENLPNANVTIYDKSTRMGGWMKSSLEDVQDGEVVFESGPRSLRPQAPNGTLALKMIQKLDLLDDMLVTPLSAPAARNRFIYYPDHLVKMPGPGQSIWQILSTLFSEPAFRGAGRAMFGEHFKPGRERDVTDESIGNFISRRFTSSLANNLASALMHGIYAGDIWKLSARSIMGRQWFQERKHGDLSEAVAQSIIDRSSWNFYDDIALQQKLGDEGFDDKLRNKIEGASVFSFKHGLQQLARKLENRLASNPRVEIRKDCQVYGLERNSNSLLPLKVLTRKGNGENSEPQAGHERSHVISTIPTPQLVDIIDASTPPESRPPRDLKATHAVTVAVVNLYFANRNVLSGAQPPRTPPKYLSATNGGVEGFGYLIPNSVPYSQNPERALGVIFDSDIVPDLHTTVEERGTRLTVMLGGHWWDDFERYPDSDEQLDMARSVLARHLGITDAPTAWRATLQRDCIPQYQVGHTARMGRTHDWLADTYNGRLRVAGCWYTGVGVNDCIRAGYDIVQGLKKDFETVSDVTRTGLESFRRGKQMALVKRKEKGVLEILKVEDWKL